MNTATKTVVKSATKSATKAVTKPPKAVTPPVVATKAVTPPVVKPAPKAETKPTLMYAALLGEALGGKYGSVLQRFYASAVNYHVKKQMTAFPRAFCAGQPLIPAKDVPEFFEKHKVSSIPSKLGIGNRLFDEMMLEMAKMPKVKPAVPKAA